MNNFKLLEGSDTIKNSREILNRNFQSIASDFSGDAFPTENLIIGMSCYRTDEQKLYKLYQVGSSDTLTWVCTLDCSGDKAVVPKTALPDSYLPLSGGKMTGTIELIPNDDAGILGSGGMILRVADATDNTILKDLLLKVDGTLSWDGKNLVRSIANVTADATGNISLDALVPATAAGHNAIYRGKYLGSSVTAAQWAAIKAGTFEDLYIGDYWTIGGVDYVIAAFDYYLHCGDTETTVHHVTLVPRKNMYTHVMNDTNIVTGGYVGSKMYKSGLNSAKTTIANAFGSTHILTIRQLYTNATNADYGFGTAFAWYDDSVFLMNEMNVYGSYVFVEFYRTTQWGADKYSPDNSQYPIFAFDKTMIHTGENYWLRNVANSTGFASVLNGGRCACDNASHVLGVRPAFNIYQS